MDVRGEPNARAVAVQDGRIVKLGYSRKLGRYVILRDVYGDVFTYAGLGSDRTHLQAAQGRARRGRRLTGPAGRRCLRPEPAGLRVGHVHWIRRARRWLHGRLPGRAARCACSPAPRQPRCAGGSRGARVLRNVDRRRAAAARRRLGRRRGHGPRPGERSGGAKDGHLRFAIQPAGDTSTIDPRAILANWTQLDAALHPQGAKGSPSLLGATASDVFLLSKGQLEREVLSDPGVALSGVLAP